MTRINQNDWLMDSLQQITSWQTSSSQSRNFQHFMEHKCSFSCSQLHATCVYLLCALPSYLFEVQLNIILPSRSYKWSVSFMFTTLYAFFFSRQCVTWPSRLFFLKLVTWMILDEEDKLWSSSFWSFIEPSVAFCIICPNIFLSTLFSDTLILVCLPQRDRPSFSSI